MSDAIKVQGWCPTAWKPMRAQDGWIVRIRPHCAALTAMQWRKLAELALAHAHPQIELTRLGNIQLRGVQESQLNHVQTQLIAAALVPADADADLAPAVHCSPFYEYQDLTHQLAQSLTQEVITRLSPRALQAQGLIALPSKFGLLVDDEQQHLSSISTDLRLRVLPADSSTQSEHPASRYALSLGSSGQTYVYASAADVIEAAVQIATWFASECTKNAEPAVTRLQQKLAYLPQDLPALQAATVLDTCSNASAISCEPVPPGQQGPHFVLGAPLGRVDAQAMLLLASQLPPSTEIRVTPWRSLFVVGGDAALAHTALDGAAWITESSDERSRVSACTGNPGCTQALIPAQQLALQSANHLPEGMHLHISGCAKLCALGKDATAVVFANQSHCAPLLLNAYAATQPQARIQIPFQASSSAPAQIQELIHELSI